MSFVTRFVGTNLDFLMGPVVFVCYNTQLVGVRVCRGVAGAGPFPSVVYWSVQTSSWVVREFG